MKKNQISKLGIRIMSCFTSFLYHCRLIKFRGYDGIFMEKFDEIWYAHKILVQKSNERDHMGIKRLDGNIDTDIWENFRDDSDKTKLAQCRIECRLIQRL
jgi:hypothetical protein